MRHRYVRDESWSVGEHLDEFVNSPAGLHERDILRYNFNVIPVGRGLLCRTTEIHMPLRANSKRYIAHANYALSCHSAETFFGISVDEL